MMIPRALHLLLAAALLSSGAFAQGGRRARKVEAAAEAAPAKKEASGAAKVDAKDSKAEAKKDTAPAPVAPGALRGPMRIDFDDRLVQGQTNKLGAVYLYQRKDAAQTSLLERRKSFREEILKDVVE